MLGRFSRSRSERRQDGGQVTQVRPGAPAPTPPSNEQAPDHRQADHFIAIKVDLHRHLLDEINLSVIERVSVQELADQIRPVVKNYITARAYALNAREIDDLVAAISDEMLGLGPIQPLLDDDTINDVLINTHRQVYIERSGRLEMTPIRFKDEAHLMRIVNKIVSAVGRRVDESFPMVDARLPDGSRVNVAVKPVAVDGP